MIEASYIPQFPHTEAALHLYDKNPAAVRHLYPDGKGTIDRRESNPQEVAIARELLEEFNRIQIDNTTIFTRDGVSIPYTHINISDFAKKLYQRWNPDWVDQTNQIIPTETDGNQSHQSPRFERHFVFPSAPTIQNGHPFTFVEIAMNEMMTKLATIWEDIEKGREIRDVEIITLGSSTNELLGHVTPEFINQLETRGIYSQAEIYADLIKQNLPANPQDRARTVVTLEGISQGASCAALAGEILVRGGIVEQRNKDKISNNLPNLVVLMRVPAGLHEPKNKKIKIVGGFMLGGLYDIIEDPYLRTAFQEKGFLNKLKPIFQRAGIATDNSKIQIELKKKGTKLMLEEKVIEGVPVWEGLRVHTVRGVSDLTSTSREWADRAMFARMQRLTRGYRLRPISAYLVPRKNPTDRPNIQEFAFRGTHNPPFFYDRVFGRWNKTIGKMLEFKQQPIKI